MYDNLKVMEYMDFYGSMYGMSKREVENVADKYLELVALQDKRTSSSTAFQEV